MDYSDKIELNNGIFIPRLGLGTSNIKNCAEIVYESIKDGVRLIDTAAYYKNEKEVGEAINKAITEGIVLREDLFVITKLWFFDKHRAEESIKESLDKLGLEYVDLFLDHWPCHIYRDENGETHKVPMHVVWANLESFVKKGYTKSIGVSNYNVQSLVNLLSFCEIKPVVNEVELHPYMPQQNLQKFCKANGIYLIAYNSLCKGSYTKRFHADVNLLEEDVVKTMAEKYNTTPGNIALNWAIKQDIIVIPATSNPRRMGENMKSLEFRLADEDSDTITKALDKNMRILNTFNYDHFMRDDLFA